jgi:membrane associated rhomboid family serine protease
VRPPENWRNARVTLVIAGVTAAAWLLAVLLGFDLIAPVAGFTPAQVAGVGEIAGALPALVTPLTATLVHDGLFHLLFNLLILLFCGRAVEGIVGGKGMAILYLLGAYAAAAGYWLPEPDAAVPMVGASGAISAVLGAYAILFGRNRMKIASPRLAVLAHAAWLAAAWIGMQFLVGLTTPGIAISAHIGGFLIGLLLARPLLLLRWRGA